MFSAALAGLAGGTKAIVLQLPSLTDMHWTTSGEVILMTLVGGMGTIFGPCRRRLRHPEPCRTFSPPCWPSGCLVIQGAIFVTACWLFRRGVVGEFAAWLRIRL